MGVLFSVAGAVWVEVYTATAALADDGKDPALVTGVGLLTLEASEGGMVGGAGGGGGLGGSQGPQWLGSLILLWQVRSIFVLTILYGNRGRKSLYMHSVHVRTQISAIRRYSLAHEGYVQLRLQPRVVSRIVRSGF